MVTKELFLIKIGGFFHEGHLLQCFILFFTYVQLDKG